MAAYMLPVDVSGAPPYVFTMARAFGREPVRAAPAAAQFIIMEAAYFRKPQIAKLENMWWSVQHSQSACMCSPTGPATPKDELKRRRQTGVPEDSSIERRR